MDETIRNIYCVGRNYREHAAELGNAVPASPMIFLKPTHAWTMTNGGDVVLPGDWGQVHYEVELVLRVGRTFERGMTVDDLVDGMALGIDFTLRDVQSELKKKGHPWLAAKGFLGSAPTTPFISFPGWDAITETPFTLYKNDAAVQTGYPRDMIFPAQTLVDHIGGTYGLRKGDVIFTGTPEGVGQALNGDIFSLAWNGDVLGSLAVRLEYQV